MAHTPGWTGRQPRPVDHTPGPWTIGHSDWMISRETSMGYRNFPVRAPEGFDIAMVYYDEDDYEQAANLHLIAAAPEMLAALKLLRDPDGDGEWTCYCDDPHFDGGKCENCIATDAIDKAEGRTDDQ